MSTFLTPSILNADFLSLKTDLDTLQKGGIQQLHLDIMDGNFVPNISFGTFLIQSIKAAYPFYIDVHLMVNHPERYIASCVGADNITIHLEACNHLDSTIAYIKKTGAKVGVALNPATPLDSLTYVLNSIDRVLIMSVNPGFGGQKLIPYTLQKIRDLQKILQTRKYSTLIQIDGGVNDKNIREISATNVNFAVVGSYLFEKNQSIEAKIATLQDLIHR